MFLDDYKQHLIVIRTLMNTLADKMGATYSSRLSYLEKIINDAVNGDLLPDGIEDAFCVSVKQPVLGGNKKCFNLSKEARS